MAFVFTAVGLNSVEVSSNVQLGMVIMVSFGFMKKCVIDLATSRKLLHPNKDISKHAT